GPLDREAPRRRARGEGDDRGQHAAGGGLRRHAAGRARSGDLPERAASTAAATRRAVWTELVKGALSPTSPGGRPSAVLVGIQLAGETDEEHEGDLAELARLV